MKWITLGYGFVGLIFYIVMITPLPAFCYRKSLPWNRCRRAEPCSTSSGSRNPQGYKTRRRPFPSRAIWRQTPVSRRNTGRI